MYKVLNEYSKNIEYKHGEESLRNRVESKHTFSTFPNRRVEIACFLVWSKSGKKLMKLFFNTATETVQTT